MISWEHLTQIFLWETQRFSNCFADRTWLFKFKKFHETFQRFSNVFLNGFFLKNHFFNKTFKKFPKKCKKMRDFEFIKNLELLKPWKSLGNHQLYRFYFYQILLQFSWFNFECFDTINYLLWQWIQQTGIDEIFIKFGENLLRGFF